jgi:hypothetical protein
LGDPKHPTLWPSEASAVSVNEYGEEVVLGKCRRAIFLRYVVDNYKFYPKYSHYRPLVEEIKKKEVPPDRYMLWIWRAGELYEEYLINISKESGVFIAEQTPLYIPSHNVSGKVDLTIINPETHLLSKVEVKSVYGHNSNTVLGTPSQRSKGALGTPRDSNLMQIALYEWWGSSMDDAYEHSRLVYGARDTGRYAEYIISTETTVEENGESTIRVFYEGNAPNKTQKTEAPFTLTSILNQYEYVQNCLDSGVVPKRDYEIAYSEEKIETLYSRDELSKSDKERFEKWKAWKDGTRSRQIKPVEKGDWQCRYCKFREVCFDAEGKPKEL